MSDLNVVVFQGRLTRDPELKSIPSGKQVATIPIAVNSVRGTGENQVKEVLVLDCVVWERRAETCAQYLQKGSSVIVTGSLKSRQWTAKDGSLKTQLEVNVNDIKFIDKLKPKDETEVAETPTEDPADIFA